MPSERHNELAKLALRWLRNKATGRGVRGGFEVPMGEGYVADAVALCCFQQRYAKLYVGEDNFDRINRFEVLVPEVVCVFEAKATRADFLATFSCGKQHENRKEPVAHFHWCVCPHNVAKPEELPEFWGMLRTRGIGLGELRKPRYCKVEEGVLEQVAYNVLWYAKNNHRPYAKGRYCGWEH